MPGGGFALQTGVMDRAGNRDGWGELVAQSCELGLEAAMVVPLRLAKLARGGPAARVEARLMVGEKVEAHGALLRALASGRCGWTPRKIAAASVRHYLGYVRANRVRLASGE